jgi:hypothetical protein
MFNLSPRMLKDCSDPSRGSKDLVSSQKVSQQ